jgi:beta-galactosidase
MSNFYTKDNLFWLDDRPLLLQAGEFHYYRTPPDQWAHRLGLLKEAGFNAVASYIPWRWHEVEEGIFDFDGHSHPMRVLAGFLDLAAAARDDAQKKCRDEQ